MTTKQIFNTSAELDYPTVLPTLDLDFANTKTLDPRITFTRSSGGSYVGADGLIKYAGVNEARFDHNPTTGESLGLLVEEQRTNLLLRSEEFNTAHWTGINVSVAANAAIAPDGATTADQITFINTSGKIFQNAVTPGNTTWTFSVWMRAVSGTFKLKISRTNTGSWANATVSPELTLTTSWQRFSLTFTTGGSDTQSGIVIGDEDLSASAMPAAGPIYAWGAQLEAGSFPTSYIPTTTSAVTRAADVPTISGSRLTSWYNYSEGTFYGEVNFSGTLKNTFTSILNVNSNGNNGIMSAAIGTSAVPTKVAVGLVNFNSLNWFPVGKAERFLSKVYRLGSFVGNPAIYDGPYPGIFHLGYNPGNPAYLNGTIKRLTFWPKRLPDAQLKALSTY